MSGFARLWESELRSSCSLGKHWAITPALGKGVLKRRTAGTRCPVSCKHGSVVKSDVNNGLLRFLYETGGEGMWCVLCQPIKCHLFHSKATHTEQRMTLLAAQYEFLIFALVIYVCVHVCIRVQCLKPEEGWNAGVAGSCEPLSLHGENETWVLEKINHWAIIPPASVVWVKHCHRGAYSTLHGKQSRLLLSTICGLCAPLTVHQGILVMRMAHMCISQVRKLRDREVC